MNPRSLITGLFLVLPSMALAQAPTDPEIEACRSTALMALKERSASVKDLFFDLETFSVSKANTKVEDTPVRTIIMGEAYLERKKTSGAQKFLCLIGLGEA